MSKEKNTAEQLRKFIRKEKDTTTVQQKKSSVRQEFVLSEDAPSKEKKEVPVQLKEILSVKSSSDKRENKKSEQNSSEPALEIIHSDKLLLRANLNEYSVLGSLSQDASSMPVTLLVTDPATGRRERDRLDLYDREEVKEFAIRLADIFHEKSELVETELIVLTDLLEKHRDKLLVDALSNSQSASAKRPSQSLSTDKQSTCVAFLSEPNLFQRIDTLIEQAGVAGQENARKLLSAVASSYKMKTPLHVQVQGTSNKIKANLINTIVQCVPEEDHFPSTRITGKSLFNYTGDELVSKLLVIEDCKGLEKGAKYALSKLQENSRINSSTTSKDAQGNIFGRNLSVKSSFATLSASSSADATEEHYIVIGIDESEEQVNKLIERQNKKIAGLISEKEEEKAKLFLQNCIRTLKSCEVVNRYAGKIQLPFSGNQLLTFNTHFLLLAKQITILHQYQRKRDELGRLITEIGDLRLACDVLFSSVVLKQTQLDVPQREFYERMKEYISGKENPKEYIFSASEILSSLGGSRAQCHRYIQVLIKLEYVLPAGGHSNTGFKFKIARWDEEHRVREQIIAGVTEQLNRLTDVK